jgi:hypothetical protein
MLVQTIRKNAAKQGAPHIIIMPSWVSRNGEPVVLWALTSRTPTPAEIAEAVASWKRKHAKQSHPNPKPTDTVAS